MISITELLRLVLLLGKVEVVRPVVDSPVHGPYPDIDPEHPI